jgi:hypothetical protein
MKRLAIIRGGVAMALMLGVLVAVASSAEASPSGQLGVYMREGLSLERAQAALATQSQVETAELPTKLEEALGASFAGMWFEPNTAKFSIGVVSVASRRAAEQVVAQAGLAGVVNYVSVRSTWAQLISAQGEWNAKLEHLGGRQFYTGLTASHNAVSVRLSSSVPEHERALLEREAARFHVNVSIKVVPPEAIVLRANNSQCEWRKGAPPYAFCSKPIAAGVLITPNGALLLLTYCTAGPLAKLAKPATLAAELETLLITAGHCLAPADREKWFTLTHPGVEHIEIGPRIEFVNGLAGDYGDIEVGPNWLQAGVTPALAQITNYQDSGLRAALNVIGEEASIEGASFCHQGATSGEQCGKIMERNQLRIVSGVHVEGLVSTNACSEGGDSGGPYHTLPTGNSVRILGTHVGSKLTQPECSVLFCPSSCETIYEPIKTSLEGLGLTLLTTANQTRHKLPHEWLIGGKLIASPVKVHSHGLLLLTDDTAPGGATAVHCFGFNSGTVGPHALDLIETITAEKLGTNKKITCKFDKTGTCEAGTAPTAEAIHLPWHTELTLFGSAVRDMVMSDGAGNPGWAVTCKTILGNVTDTCENALTSTALEIVSSGVLALFDATSNAANCKVGGEAVRNGAGLVSGDVTILSPGGGAEEKLTEE